MLNNEVVLNTAANLSKKTIAESEEEHKRIAFLYHQLFGRPATPKEQSVAALLLRESRETRQQLAAAGEEEADVESGAWEDLCVSLICSNEFMYVD